MDDTTTILVVDDDAYTREIYRKTFQWLGYRTLTASDGLEALKTLETQAVDLVVTDVKMPRLDGYHLFRAAIASPKIKTVPFIFLSAYAQDRDIDHCRALGVAEFLIKPVDPDDLVAAVRDILKPGSRGAV